MGGLVTQAVAPYVARGLVKAGTKLLSDDKPHGVWGERGSFPHALALMYVQIEQAKKRESDNELRRKAEVAALEAKLKELLKAQRGQKVAARVSVTSVARDTLLIDGDISWGWPTHLPAEFKPETEQEIMSPRCGLLRIVTEDISNRHFIPLAFESQVPKTIERMLNWNEKALVEFEVQEITQFGNLGIVDTDDEDPLPPFAARVRGLKFVEPINAVGNPAWPQPDTFADSASYFAPWNEWRRTPALGTADLHSFLAYANRTLRNGQAHLHVIRVTDTEVVLSSDVVSREGWKWRVFLREGEGSASEINIPVAAVGRERAFHLSQGSPLLVTFDIEEVVAVYGWLSGVQVSVRNVRVADAIQFSSQTVGN